MTKWKHSVCVECWYKLQPYHDPVRIREEFLDEQADICCFCGRLHQSGIYLRRDPVVCRCQGQHERT